MLGSAEDVGDGHGLVKVLFLLIAVWNVIKMMCRNLFHLLALAPLWRGMPLRGHFFPAHLKQAWSIPLTLKLPPVVSCVDGSSLRFLTAPHHNAWSIQLRLQGVER